MSTKKFASRSMSIFAIVSEFPCPSDWDRSMMETKTRVRVVSSPQAPKGHFLLRAWRLLALVLVGLGGVPMAGANEPAEVETLGGLSLFEVIEATLRHDPNIAVAENRVRSSEGAQLVAAGRFDPVLSSSVFQNDTKVPTASGSTSTSTSTVGVDLARELRTGLSVEPSVTVERTDGGGVVDSTATVAFVVRQPLFRNRGRAVVTAEEQAVGRELAADRLDLEHRISQRLQAVAAQYWSVRAASMDLEVLREAETRSRELLVTTRRLIASDVTPAAEIVQLEADTTFREAARIAGERALFEARQQLGLEIGLEPSQTAALGIPVDDFPQPDVEAAAPPSADQGWIAQALDRRADLRAERERLAAAHLRLVAAENALAPQLDLVFTPSYTGRSDGQGVDGTFSALFDDVPGLSTSVGLSLMWPTRNRRAEGGLIQSRAAVTAVALTVEQRAKAIGAAVPTALDGVRQRARELDKFSAAVELFRQALNNEIKKLRAGSSTLIDVLSQRDRLTSVQRTEIAARLGLAVAIAEVRFQTGTLWETSGGATSIGALSTLHLTTLPR